MSVSQREKKRVQFLYNLQLYTRISSEDTEHITRRRRTVSFTQFFIVTVFILDSDSDSDSAVSAGAGACEQVRSSSASSPQTGRVRPRLDQDQDQEGDHRRPGLTLVQMNLCL